MLRVAKVLSTFQVPAAAGNVHVGHTKAMLVLAHVWWTYLVLCTGKSGANTCSPSHAHFLEYKCKTFLRDHQRVIQMIWLKLYDFCRKLQ
jgi:hypothetical protein